MRENSEAEAAEKRLLGDRQEQRALVLPPVPQPVVVAVGLAVGVLPRFARRAQFGSDLLAAVGDLRGRHFVTSRHVTSTTSARLAPSSTHSRCRTVIRP